MTWRSSAVGVGVLIAALARPADAGRWPTPAAGPSATGGPELVITFDDGPHESYTPKILDTLRDHGVSAVFFWVGRRVKDGLPHVDERRALVDRAVREGHIIANHTVSHTHMCQLSAERMAAEIADNAALYQPLVRMRLVWFRTPFGSRCKRLVRVLREQRVDHLHWDLDPQEWRDHSARRVVRYTTNKLRRLEGRAVLILHDTHHVTAAALPEILDWIDEENARRRERGAVPIRIVSGSELAREQLAPGLLAWMSATATSARRSLWSVARLLPDGAGPTVALTP